MRESFNPNLHRDPTTDESSAEGVTRREFTKTTVAAGLAVGAGAHAWAAESKSGDMIYRTLGRTGEKVSAIGIGGFHMGSPSEDEGIRIVRTAVDRGVTFMDNCWDYHDGGSEERMGKALRDGYREKAFLMTKIDGRSKKNAARQIDESLRRLQTDRIDLLQHHEIIRVEDPDRIFAEGGAQEAVLEAKKAGKIRYVGFTGHKDPFVHLRMIEIAKQHGFRFDAVQMPLNVMDAHFRSFEKQVLPLLVQDGVGVLGMKPLGSGAILKSGNANATECLHYALNLPTSVVITGIDQMKYLDQALEAVRTFKPMSAQQVTTLLSRTEKAAMTGKHEGFKTGTEFDATARHPDWIS
ncbi:MAG TPA: aldo/keto reductase [Candidatus Acidoferrum sp.]|nr:aldo/keto reductase [Candidatus Acidoferrum sp.]